MSANPFTADPGVALFFATFPPERKAEIQAEAARHILRDAASAADNMGGVLRADIAARIVAAHDLGTIRTLMILLLGEAQKFARPPISNFFVGAVGLEAGTGHLVLGGNVEFPGTHLGLTLHGEGFVFTRAFSRGSSIEAIAIGEAHPCAHCRQYLSEFASSPALELIDPLGHTLTLAQLFPWPFDPAYLGESGAVPGKLLWPELTLDGDVAHAEALLAAGRKAHSPYSRCPGAVVLEMKDGTLLTGASIESVAFNPTIQPLQAALVDLLAHGFTYDDLRSVSLGTVLGGAVDYSATTRELLEKVAPDARLNIAGWTI